MTASAGIESSNYVLLRQQVEQAFPWLAPWITQPAGVAPLGRRLLPRDFLRTPLALNLVNLDPDDGAFLLKAEVPWRALQRILQLYYTLKFSALAGGAPLHQAIILGDYEGARALLHTGAKLDGVMCTGHTGLTLATLLGRGDMVALLLEHGFNPAAMDLLGNTPLHWAGVMRDGQIAATLLSYGASTEVENLFGAQPLDYDAAWEQTPPAELAVDVVDTRGQTRTLRTQAEFRQLMGFDYLPCVRPGIDFYVQMAAGLAQPKWLKAVHEEMRKCPPFPRAGFEDVPMYLKDFGAPWGYGVCTRRPIAAGEAVTPYVGDLVHTFENMVEVLNYGVNPYSSNAQPTARLQELFMSHFDAWRSGNLGSRINSAEYDGAQCLRFSCRFWRGLPRSQFFALRDIEANEQLSWYYGDGYWAARGFDARPLPKF